MRLIKRIQTIILCAVIAVAFTAALVPAAQEQATHRTVRVAFPSQEGMSEIGEGGDLLGYNYDYLQTIAEYAGWELEYVTYENQSTNSEIESAMEMVMSGEADLIGPMLKSEAVEEMFEFPENEYGVVYTTLCSLEESTLSALNFTKCSPLRVAVYSGAKTRNQEVQQYLDQLQIQYELVPCESTEEQMESLREGRADVLSSITLSFFEGTRAVAEFAPRPYYFVTTKGNEELIAELDSAIEDQRYTLPELQGKLQELYFGDTSGGYTLSTEEQEYMDGKPSLEVLCIPNYAPYVSMNSEGEASGILVSLLNDFAQDNGIRLSYHFGSSAQSMEKEWKTGKYDCMLGLPLSSKYCSENGLVRAQSLLDSGMSIYSKQRTHKKPEESSIAVYQEQADSFDLKAYKTVILAEHPDDCIVAVETGEADYAYTDQLSADYLIFENGFSIVSTPVLGKQQHVQIAVSRTLDRRLLSSLNKYIHTLPDSTKTNYLSIAGKHENSNLQVYIRTHPIQTVLFASIAVTILFGTILLLVNYRKNKLRNIELVNANSAKSEFLSRMSHDIRTPLNAILGFAELGKQDAGSSKLVMDDLNRISSSGKFLLGLVNDVLDMTKIESNAMTLNPEPYTNAEFKEQLSTLVEPLCAKKSISFTINMADNVPPCVYVDKLRFNQIFFNLLSNAVKFTPEGGKIEVSWEMINEYGKMAVLKFTVKDNGIGMSKEFQKTMFDSFTQEHQHITGQEGTGLGLSIVKSLVKLMDGKIDVDSVPGKGTEFTIQFEVEVCPDYKTEETKTREEVYPELKGKKILLCEDHPMNTMLATRLLEKVGCQVECAVNGQEGVNTFEKSEVGYLDAVLMDIRMPVMDGHEATRAIRALNREDAKKVPIIAMTANAFDEDVQASREAGMNEHLTKPIDPRLLYHTLAKCMMEADNS